MNLQGLQGFFYALWVQFGYNIISDDPVKTAHEFYDKAAYGGITKTMANGKGETAKMKDGTIILYRTSSAGSPAVEINISKSTDSGGVKRQKIHFAKE